MKNAIIACLIFLGIQSALAGDCQPVYQVPNQQTELRAVSEFKVNQFLSIQSAKEQFVQYEMPAELTGPNKVVSFRGPIVATGPMILSGDTGTMTCIALSCQVQFKNLSIDMEKARTQIAAVSLSDQERKARLQVLAGFSTDPGGTITYPENCYK